ncbi:hypothetical protein LCGC14_0798400 [marine sediment metagenome]|uniref:HNH nuclease domain-containing protein n=1 Tax=marine sediment metagenome TaxID=412755 RepID=A0A0F9SXJ2_9ZZZZ
MKRIPLSQGQFAIIDDEDYTEISQYKWYARLNPHTQSYYAQRNVLLIDKKRTVIQMSRSLLMLCYGDKRQVDHINHNTLDNRRKNLRIVTNQQNHFNRKAAKGYHWNVQFKKYKAKITLSEHDTFLGYHDTPESARLAYLAAKEKYHRI